MNLIIGKMIVLLEIIIIRDFSDNKPKIQLLREKEHCVSMIVDDF